MTFRVELSHEKPFMQSFLFLFPVIYMAPNNITIMATIKQAQVTVRIRWRPPEEPPDQYIVEVIPSPLGRWWGRGVGG